MPVENMQFSCGIICMKLVLRLWRREGDLNSRGTGPPISSRAHYQAMRSRPQSRRQAFHV